jgi:hypothetical protein
VSDQDRKTPDEEKEVEAHALQDYTEAHEFEKQGDDVEAHALRDPEEFTEFERDDKGEKEFE